VKSAKEQGAGSKEQGASLSAAETPPRAGSGRTRGKMGNSNCPGFQAGVSGAVYFGALAPSIIQLVAKAKSNMFPTPG